MITWKISKHCNILVDQIWNEKIKTDSIQKTIKIALDEIHKGKFEEIREEDEEDYFSSKFNSHKTVDKDTNNCLFASNKKDSHSNNVDPVKDTNKTDMKDFKYERRGSGKSMLYVEGKSNKFIPVQKNTEIDKPQDMITVPIKNEKIDEFSDLCSEMFSEDNDGSKLMTELQSRNSKDSINMKKVVDFFPQINETSQSNKMNFSIDKKPEICNEDSLGKILNKDNNDNDDDYDEEDHSEIICSENMHEDKDDSISNNSKYNIQNYEIQFDDSKKKTKEFYANPFNNNDKNFENSNKTSDDDVSDKSFKELNQINNFSNCSKEKINTMDICIKEKNFNSESEFDENNSKYSKNKSKQDLQDIQDIHLIEDKLSEKKMRNHFKLSGSQTSLKNKSNNIRSLSHRNYSEKNLSEDFKHKKQDFTKKKIIEQFSSNLKSIKSRSKSPISHLKKSLNVDHFIENKQTHKKNTELSTLTKMFNNLKNSISTQKLSSNKQKPFIKMKINNNKDNSNQYKKIFSKSSNIKKSSLKKSISISNKKKQFSPILSNPNTLPCENPSNKYKN